MSRRKQREQVANEICEIVLCARSRPELAYMTKPEMMYVLSYLRITQNSDLVLKKEIARLERELKECRKKLSRSPTS